MGEVITIRSRKGPYRAERHPICGDDVYRWWAIGYVAPEGAEIAYLPDRARIFNPDGTHHDVLGGQMPADWSKILR